MKDLGPLNIVALTSYTNKKNETKEYGIKECLNKPLGIFDLMLIYGLYYELKSLEHVQNLIKNR